MRKPKLPSRTHGHAPLCERCLRPGAFKGKDDRTLHMSCRLERKRVKQERKHHADS